MYWDERTWKGWQCYHISGNQTILLSSCSSSSNVHYLEFEEGDSSSLFLTMDVNYFIEINEGSIQLNYSLAKNVLWKKEKEWNYRLAQWLYSSQSLFEWRKAAYWFDNGFLSLEDLPRFTGMLECLLSYCLCRLQNFPIFSDYKCWEPD